MEKHDAVIIGGGPAGLAAATALYEKGIHDILIIEREKAMGGILRQCIHDGFGLTRFGETLSGPEYADRFLKRVMACGIPYKTNTSVIDVTEDRVVTAAGPEGLIKIEAKAVIFAMGCRERTRGALAIPGERPAGVFTAGTAQAYMNLFNRMVGREVVILGSGDIGMIMARRLTLEGAHVKAVFEIAPIPSGLPRNIEQCLNDYGIPLFLSHTITEIHGKDRVRGVTVSEVDEKYVPIPGTEVYYDCDTVILSAGLIPENELTQEAGIALDARTKGAVVDEFFQAGKPGFFAAGNVLHVHDLVDFVSLEAERLADGAAEWIKNGSLEKCRIEVSAGPGIGHVLPQKISGSRDVDLSMRPNRKFESCRIIVKQGGRILAKKDMAKALPAEMIQLKVKKEAILSEENIEVSVEETGMVLHHKKDAVSGKEGLSERTFTCIICPNGCEITARYADGKVESVEGNLCGRGAQYVRQEILDPKRTIASSVLVEGGVLPLTSVRLTAAIPKDKIFVVMDEIRKVKLKAPVQAGEVVIADILGLGSDVMVTKTVEHA